MPAGKIDGTEPRGRDYLAGIEEMSGILMDAGAIDNLDDETSYTADDLRDKLIELITALKG